MKKTTFTTILFLLLFCSIDGMAYAQSPQITSGLSYLSANQNQDGSWQSTSADGFHSTAEVLSALSQTGNKDASYTNGVNWLNLQSIDTTDYLAKRITILGSSYLSTDLSTVLSYRNTDNGWGGYLEYTSNNRDTALSLLALKAANYTDQTVINNAITYLLSNQNADGGFGFYPSTCTGCNDADDSNIYMTALVSWALQQFPQTTSIATAVNKATSYLIANQNTDGGFGSSGSTVYETALSIIALIKSGQGQALPLQNAINYLLTTQQADGSWNQDPYSTALALRALANVKPNLSISTSDISFSKTMPLSGEEITITATIKNTGLEDASNVLVRFYQGNPANGGTQIGADQIIQIIAHGSLSEAAITTSFTSTGSKTIYALIDPDNLISEISKNEKGGIEI